MHQNLISKKLLVIKASLVIVLYILILTLFLMKLKSHHELLIFKEYLITDNCPGIIMSNDESMYPFDKWNHLNCAGSQYENWVKSNNFKINGSLQVDNPANGYELLMLDIQNYCLNDKNITGYSGDFVMYIDGFKLDIVTFGTTCQNCVSCYFKSTELCWEALFTLFSGQICSRYVKYSILESLSFSLSFLSFGIIIVEMIFRRIVPHEINKDNMSLELLINRDEDVNQEN
jgi:hypothetical protein